MADTEVKNPALYDDLDALLDASMDDLDDLPPIGVPPSGHYNLTVTFDIEEIDGEKGKKSVPTASYVVDVINELKDPEELTEVAVGQQFKEFFHTMKRDGTPNKFGMGTLKSRLQVYQERFGTSKVGELIKEVKQIQVAATVIRKVNRKNEDQFNMNLKDVVIL